MSPGRVRRQDPVVQWEANPLVARRVRVTVKNWPFAWTAYMGDTKLHEETGERWVEHTYAQPGSYWLYVTRQGESTAIGEAQIVVRAARDPQVTFSRHPDFANVLRVHWPALDETRVVSDYTVDWDPDGPGEQQTVTGLPGSFTEHAYASVAQYGVTIRDLQTRRLRRFNPQLPIPTIDPDFTLAHEPADPSGRTVTLTVTANASGQALFVVWGDGGIAEPLGGDTATHQFRSTVDTTYLVQLWHAGATQSVSKPIAIPGGTP